ncbi:MAG: hypothetical protein JNM09_27790 [Blastocatellia bacterium]|nr:hypothetical protein [Blastocatellia bacterium]
MDIALPGHDGVAATRKLLQACPAARVLIVTSYGDGAAGGGGGAGLGMAIFIWG